MSNEQHSMNIVMHQGTRTKMNTDEEYKYIVVLQDYRDNGVLQYTLREYLEIPKDKIDDESKAKLITHDGITYKSSKVIAYQTNFISIIRSFMRFYLEFDYAFDITDLKSAIDHYKSVYDKAEELFNFSIDSINKFEESYARNKDKNSSKK